MKIYLLLAHPDSDSFNGRIARAYAEKATARGHEVRYQQLGNMAFDPILWQGYKTVQQLEPDLKQAQENILWCEKWVIVYPLWWGAMPALLKGFLDRTLLPGFAFKHHDKDPLWDKLLKGRCAEVITTADSPWWWVMMMYRNSDLHMIKRATLNYCGISPVKVIRVSRVRYLDENARQQWIKKITDKIP